MSTQVAYFDTTTPAVRLGSIRDTVQGTGISYGFANLTLFMAKAV